MQELYSIIDSILSRVDYESIWKGFRKSEFALYNQEMVYFSDDVVPWDKRFLGNTAIDYNGRTIAIWSVESPETEDSEYLAADIVHEMFHVYQKQQGETRFPNDLELLAYPDNLRNYQIKALENELLIKAFSEKNYMALKQFIALREVRVDIINEFIIQEYCAETSEGMAEYAGLAALEQINSVKFSARIEGYLSKLSTPNELLFSPRHISYFSGAVLCLTLRLVNFDFYHELTEKQTLYEIIKNNIDKDPIGYSEYIENKRKKFDDFLNNHKDIHVCDSYISGYDPMNMTRLENKILCNHFIMLNEEFIKGPVIVELQDGTVNKVKSYIK